MIDTVLMSADAMALQSYEKDIELSRVAALADEKNAELARSAGLVIHHFVTAMLMIGA